MVFRDESGIAQIILVLIGVILISSAIVYTNLSDKTHSKITSTSSPLNADNPTASPSASPSSNPTASPSIAPTSQPTKAATPAPVVSNTAPSSGHSKISVSTPRGTFTSDVIVLPIGAQMITDTASDNNCDNDCPVKSLADYISANGAYAGINGSYFCPDTYDECQSKKNTFDLPVYNSRLHKWINEDKLFWDGRSLIYRDGGGMHFSRNAKDFHGSLDAGIGNFPALVDNGNAVADQYSLSTKQATKGTKGALGFNDSHIYVVMNYNVDMMDSAEVMKALGAKFAINLDGGGSTALWYGGYAAGPGRGLPNAVVFK